MICPQCKAEYRQGFTICADCGVPLVLGPETGVSRLEAPRPPATPGDPNEDPYCEFWHGDDPRLHAELSALLAEASIPYKTVRRGDHLFNLKNYPAFQIGVPFSLFERAEQVVKAAFDLDGSDPDAVQSLSLGPLLPQFSGTGRKLPEQLSPPASEAIPGPPTTGDDPAWPVGSGTVQIWSGDDRSLSNMLIAALNENGIHSRSEAKDDRRVLFVEIQNEKRAREIVREITESEPLE